MRSAKILALLAAAALAAACGRTGNVEAKVICEATVLNAAGTTVAVLRDTVTVAVSAVPGAVVPDTSSCSVVSHGGGYTVLNAKDSAAGSTTP